MIAEKDMKFFAEFIVGTAPLALDATPTPCENYDWLKGFLNYVLPLADSYRVNHGEKSSLTEDEKERLLEIRTNPEGLVEWENLELFSGEELIFSGALHAKVCRIYNLNDEDAQALVQIAREFKIFFRADVYGLLEK